MSEHDYWQVESSVYGGVGYAPATLEEYVVIAKLSMTRRQDLRP